MIAPYYYGVLNIKSTNNAPESLIIILYKIILTFPIYSIYRNVHKYELAKHVWTW